ALHADWARAPNSYNDPDAREKEMRLRDKRNGMIMERLGAGAPVFYSSSGNSMWPLVQSGDHCLFHPIQAITAMDGSPHIIEKDESPIAVGDVVFCRVQPTHQYYAHFVRHAEWDSCRQENKYIQVLPLYKKVAPLVAQDEWSNAAERMCEAESDADMEPPVPVHEDDTETAAALAEFRSVTGPPGRFRKAWTAVISGEPRGQLDQALAATATPLFKCSAAKASRLV
ncbi:unnamed protein product, partial [Prorocentrum cordatum]